MLLGPRDSLCLGWSWALAITDKQSGHEARLLGRGSPQEDLSPSQEPHVNGGPGSWGSPGKARTLQNAGVVACCSLEVKVGCPVCYEHLVQVFPSCEAQEPVVETLDFSFNYKFSDLCVVFMRFLPWPCRAPVAAQAF